MSKVYTDNIEKRTGGTAMAVPATGKWPTANIADDAITATQIAADAVGTSEIAANAVDTSEIAANAVTLTELEDGTQGDILYYGASGAPARLGFGTTGQLLKTQGTGANPAWTDAPTGGLSQVSVWRLTVTSAGDLQPISSNLEEVDTDGYARIGSAMTESSGVFTFPVTGIWRIDVQFYYGIISNQNFAFGRGALEVSTDSASSWSIAAQCAESGTDSSTTDEASAAYYVSHVLDVTSTSTHKVRFSVLQQNSNAYTQGHTDHTFTGFTFTKLGDT